MIEVVTDTQLHTSSESENDMAERFSIYAGPPVIEALSALGPRYAENRSGRLNTVCDRYNALMQAELRNMPFTRAQWCMIMDCNNGMELSTGAALMSASMVWANIHDADSSMSEKWGTDRDELARTIQAMPRGSQFALLEAIDRFWSRAEEPTDEAFKAAGITPRETAPA